MRIRSAVLGLFLFAGAGLWADTVPGHFTIDLNSPLGCMPQSSVCSNAWGTVDFTLQYNTGLTVAGDGFTNNFQAPSPIDPSMEMDAGGASIPIVSNDFIFTDDAATCPGGICSFQNDTGVDWTDVLISANNIYAGESFDCGSNLFVSCGFRATNSGFTIEALFSGIDNSHPGIVSAIPEPGTLTMLFGGLGLTLVFARRNSRRQRACCGTAQAAAASAR